MPTAVVTFNGRITLPPQIRKQLGLRTGDSVDFVEVEKGRSDFRNSRHPESSVEPQTVS